MLLTKTSLDLRAVFCVLRCEGGTKTWRVMQLTATLLLVFSLTLSARTSSQTVSFSGTNVSWQTVFKAIEDQTGYSVVTNKTRFDREEKISVSAVNAGLLDFMDLILKARPWEFEVKSKTIFIRSKKPAESLSPRVPSLDLDAPPIKGVIRDADGKPIVGANIVVKGTKRGVATNTDGTFSIDANEGDVLLFSSVGFGAKEIRIGADKNINLVLDVSNSPLDEVQILAYGKTLQRYATGNVTTITAKDIEKQPINNPLYALVGRVPGLLVTQVNGIPGSGVSALIQGQNSIQNGNDPLYVVDGVPFPSQLLPNLGNIILGNSGYRQNGNGGNSLNFINPSDIESMSILKDADATAIYGSRAANGAILITTKKGKAGATKIDFNLQSGWGKITKKVDLLNTPQYLQMRHEAINNDGLNVGPGDYDLNGTWDTTKYTDWQKVLIGGTSQFTNLNGSISGGNTNTQYLIGGTFTRQTTVFPGSFADNKGAVHFNVTSSTSNQRFHISLSGNFLTDNNNLPYVDLTRAALTLAPDAPSLKTNAGGINWEPTNSGTSSFGNNPLAAILNKYSNKTNNLVGNLTADYQIFRNLSVKSSFGYTNTQSNEIVTYPLSLFPPEFRSFLPRTANYSNNNINSWIVEPQAAYHKTTSTGKLDIILGTSIQQRNSNGWQVAGSGYNSDALLENIMAASTITARGSAISTYKYFGAFGRLNYIINSKYILDLNVRRDGSSRFGAANQFHNFWSAAGAWIFTQEKWANEALPFLSFGKLKLSYGTTGNDQIPDYAYLTLYNPIGGRVPYQNGSTALSPAGLPNPYLQWEETKKLNVGLDLAFFKERLIFGINYSQNRSSNELLAYNVPIITGFSSVFLNFPATVKNTIWQVTVNSTNIKTKEFQWSSYFNITLPDNKLIAFPDLASSSYAHSLAIGKSLGVRKVFHFLGVDPTTGSYQVADQYGKPTFTPDYLLDNNVFINTNPKFYGGLENNISFKDFQLSFLFQFIKQIGSNFRFGNFMPGTFNTNEPTTVLDRWKKSSDIASTQRYNSNYSLYSNYFLATGSDAQFTDASFIRLKNISISYQLPATWQRKLNASYFRIYLQAQNLITFTKFVGMDPETQSGTSLPPLKVLTFGLQMTL